MTYAVDNSIDFLSVARELVAKGQSATQSSNGLIPAEDIEALTRSAAVIDAKPESKEHTIFTRMSCGSVSNGQQNHIVHVRNTVPTPSSSSESAVVEIQRPGSAGLRVTHNICRTQYGDQYQEET